MHCPSFKRYLSAAACFIILMAGAFTMLNLRDRGIGADPSSDSNHGPLTGSPGTGIVQMADAAELSEAVGFEVKDITGLPFDDETRVYTSYWNEFAQIMYTGEGQSAVYRKSVESGDNSGDYNMYNAVVQITVDSVNATLKGDSDGYRLGIWSDGSFSYSIKLSEGLSEEEWKTMIAEVMSD